MPPSDHWVCFVCRKQFRKPLRSKCSSEWSTQYQTLEWKREVLQVALTCPECNTLLVNMGKYFKPPRHNDRQEWEKMQRLAEHGIRLNKAGTVAWLRFVGGVRPNKRDVDLMIACCTCHTRTEGQRLLLKIARKSHKQK